ncbi:methyl-accepting chemotaxis protein [Pseudomonas oryzihabitans]
MPFARSLRSQSLLLFGGSLLLMLLIALAGFALLSRELHRYQHLIEGPLERLVEIDDTHLTFKIQVQEWKNFLLRGGDADTAERYWQAFLTREAEVDQRLQQLATRVDPELQPRLQALRTQHGRLGERYRAGHAAYLAHDRDPRRGDAEVRGIDRETAEGFAALVDELHGRTAAQIATIRAEAQRDILLAGLALLLCGGGLLFLGVRLVERRLVDPLVTCARQLGLLARGRFGERLPGGRDDWAA